MTSGLLECAKTAQGIGCLAGQRAPAVHEHRVFKPRLRREIDGFGDRVHVGLDAHLGQHLAQTLTDRAITGKSVGGAVKVHLKPVGIARISQKLPWLLPDRTQASGCFAGRQRKPGGII